MSRIAGLFDTREPFGDLDLAAFINTASYVIFTRDVGGVPYYYAKNGVSGVVEFSGTDALTVIQDIVNILSTTGGKILIKRGIYTLTSSLIIPHNTEGLWICGEGRSTVLTSTLDIPLIINGINFRIKNSKISDIALDGHGSRTSPNRGIDFSISEGCIYENLWFLNGFWMGLSFTSSSSTRNTVRNIYFPETTGAKQPRSCFSFQGGTYLTVENIYVAGTTGIPIRFDGGSKITVDNVQIGYANDVGIHIDWLGTVGTGVQDITIKNCIINNAKYGIVFGTETINGKIIDNIIKLSPQDAILLHDSRYCEISGNTIYNCGSISYAAYGVKVAVAENDVAVPNVNNIVKNNIIYDTRTPPYQCGLQNVGTAGGPDPGGNVFSSNILINLSVTYLYGGGPLPTRIALNSGFVTENSGSAIITAAATSIVVAHGCSYTPSALDVSVVLTNLPTNDIGDVYVDTFTATQFTIRCRNVPGVATAIFNWRVIKTP